MFNAKWVGAKEVNGPSLEYEFQEISVNWSVEGIVTCDLLRVFPSYFVLNNGSNVLADAIRISGFSANLFGEAKLATLIRVNQSEPREANLKGIATFNADVLRTMFVSCDLEVLGHTTVSANPFSTKLPAPPQRCFKVGAYVSTFYVDELYKDQAA